jgi:peptidylprolyl isomerase
MVQAKKGDTVQVHYTGKLKDGTVFDSSAERDPLQFTIGEGQVINGFEDAVVGMLPEESKTVTIAADEAYGPHHEELIVDIPRDQIPPHVPLDVGQRLQVQQDEGQTIVVEITEVTDAKVTIDANHPLAGEELTFHIELVTIV